jgi:hypothetical protein
MVVGILVLRALGPSGYRGLGELYSLLKVHLIIMLASWLGMLAIQSTDTRPQWSAVACGIAQAAVAVCLAVLVALIAGSV